MSRWFLLILLGLGGLVACSHNPPSSQPVGNGAFYFDAAHDDKNRAPASMLPPKNAAELENRIDSVSLRAKADYHYSMAEAFSFEGQHQQAVESLKSTLIYDPSSPQVYLRLSAELVKQGHVSEALDAALAAEKLDPKKVDTLLLLGGLYSTLKDYKKAIACYDRILEIEPKNTEAPMYLGAVYAETKEREKAIKYFQSLAKNDENPNPHLSWYYMGRVYGDWDTRAYDRAAVNALKKALSIKPDHLDSVMALGQVYQRLSQPQLAIAAYKQFQKDNGPSDRLNEILAQYYLDREEYVEALEYLELLERNTDDMLGVKVRIAMIQIELKKFPQAAEKLFEVLRQVPESDKIRFYLAAVYEEMGEKEKAVEHFSKIPSDSSFFNEAITHASYLLKSLRKVDEALKLVEEALEQKSNVPQFYTISATLWDEKGNTARAENRLLKGLEKFPDNVQLNFFLGTIFDRKGDKAEVIKQMEKVISMDPHHVQGLNYLAFTYAEMGDKLDEAESLAKRALVIEPKDGYILDTYGWILFKKGKVAEAIKYLEKAHENQPNESVIAEHLGDAYHHAQLFERAKNMYEKAMVKADSKKKAGEIEQKIVALETQDTVKVDGGNRQPASVKESAPNKNPSLD